MRILGCALIMLSGLLAGWGNKVKLEQELSRWKYLLYFFQLTASELQTSLATSRELLERVLSRCNGLDFLNNLNDGETVQQQLKWSAEKLDKGEFQDIFLRFADCFGSSSSEVQLNSIAVLQQLCQEQIDLLQQRNQREGKLSLNLGLWGGMALAILFW